MHIIKVPAVYTLKLPGGEWLNLALIRRLQLESKPPCVLVTWENGDTQIYHHDKAAALIDAWSKIDGIDQSVIDAEILA